MSFDQLYPTGYADAALAAQTAKIRAQKVNIRKVFIVDEPGELDEIESTPQKQQRQGIDVSYILCDKIQTDRVLREIAKSLETTDFGLFDSRIALLWFLEKDRLLVGGKVLVRGETLERYRSFFNTLCGEATGYTSRSGLQTVDTIQCTLTGA